MELDHEKFEGMKELAEISTQISAGTAALASLRENEEAYISERERDLIFRLEQSLVDSKDLITSIGTNHSALVGYRNEVVDFHKSILSLIQGVMECRNMVEKASDGLVIKIAQYESDIESLRNGVRQHRLGVESDRLQLAVERKQLVSDQRFVADLKGTLEREIARINSKK